MCYPIYSDPDSKLSGCLKGANMVFGRGNFRGLLLLPYRQGAAIFVGGVLCGNKTRSDEHHCGKRGNGGKAQRTAS